MQEKWRQTTNRNLSILQLAFHTFLLFKFLIHIYSQLKRPADSKLWKFESLRYFFSCSLVYKQKQLPPSESKRHSFQHESNILWLQPAISTHSESDGLWFAIFLSDRGNQDRLISAEYPSKQIQHPNETDDQKKKGKKTGNKNIKIWSEIPSPFCICVGGRSMDEGLETKTSLHKYTSRVKKFVLHRYV